MKTIFRFQTNGPGLYEFTGEVASWVCQESDGLLTLFIKYTSESLLIQENADPDVKWDLNAFFERLMPQADDPQMSYLRHTYEGPDDMPAHIKKALLPTSLSIPVSCGKMSLGQWQAIDLFEHRNIPQYREVSAYFLI